MKYTDMKEMITNSKFNLDDSYKKRSWSFSSNRISTLEIKDETDDVSVTKTVIGWSPFNISVEPLLFALVFITTFSQGVQLNLLERNVCVQRYNFSILECSTNVNSSMKTYLQGAAAEVNLIITMIQGIFPVALSLFVGPWSDSNGRKPFMMLPFAGYFLYYVLWSVISMYPYVPIKYLLIPSIPLSLTGGQISVLVCCYCYLCDLFDSENRTFRFNVTMSSYLAGGLLANFTVSNIFNAAGDYGFTLVFFISSIVAGFSFMYVWLCLDETIEKSKGKCRLFSFNNAKSVAVVLVRRPKGELITILLTVVILVAEILLKAGEGSIEYLIGKTQFSWTLEDYTLFSSVNTIIAVLSSVLGSLIMKRLFRFENATIILISAVMMTLAEILRGGSTSQEWYWVCTGLTKQGSIIGPTIAAEMSNVVTIEDLGKVYAFNALVESLSGYLSAPIYTSIYRELLPHYTLRVYFISSAVSAVIIIGAILLLFNNRRYKKDSYVVNIK